MVTVIIDNRTVNLGGTAAALVQALVEFEKALPRQEKFKVEIDVAGTEIRIKPMPVYIFKRE